LENIKTDADVFDEVNINAADIEPMITYGTNPGMGIGFCNYSECQTQAEGEETYKKSLAIWF
jgi:3-isopropylmalate/(R)-2-methylmalate dehydratase large subunit